MPPKKFKQRRLRTLYEEAIGGKIIERNDSQVQASMYNIQIFQVGKQAGYGDVKPSQANPMDSGTEISFTYSGSSIANSEDEGVTSSNGRQSASSHKPEYYVDKSQKFMTGTQTFDFSNSEQTSDSCKHDDLDCIDDGLDEAHVIWGGGAPSIISSCQLNLRPDLRSLLFERHPSIAEAIVGRRNTG